MPRRQRDDRDRRKAGRALERAQCVADVLDETGHETPGAGASHRWLNGRPFDGVERARQRRPVGHLRACEPHRFVVCRTAGPGALVDRLELDSELLDDLDLALGRDRERRQLRTHVVTPVDRHYAGRILAT
jgi:hypothetical protein